MIARLRAWRAPRLLSAHPYLWALLFVAGLFLLLRPVLIADWPGRAALGAVGSLALFLLPGAAVLVLLGRLESEASPLEWLAHAFAASFVVLAAPTLVVLLRHSSLSALLLAYVVLTAALVVAAILRISLPVLVRDAAAPEAAAERRGASSDGWLLRLTPYVTAALLAFVALAPVQAADDWFVMGYIQDDLVAPRINLDDPFFGPGLPMHPRYGFSPWLVEEALAVRLSGLDLVTWYNGWIVLLVVVSVGAYYAAARKLLPDGRAAALATGVVAVYLLATLTPDQPGRDFFPRIAEDKMVARFIFAPLAFAAALGALAPSGEPTDGRRLWGVRLGDWVWLLIITQALGFIHPEGIVFLGLPLVGFGLLELYAHPRRQTVGRLALAAAIVVFALTLPVIQYISASGTPEAKLPPRAATLTDAGDPLLWTHLLHSFSAGTRLWLYDNGSYSVHPSRFLTAFGLLAFAGALALAFRLRRSAAARLLVGIFAVIPPLLLFPPAVTLLTRFLTPWLMHRLAWPLDSLAVPLVLTWMVWTILKRARLQAWAPLAIVVVAIVALRAPIQSGLAGLHERRLSVDSCPALGPILRQVSDQMPVHATLLADSDVSACVPGYAPFADLVAYGGRALSACSRWPATTRRGSARSTSSSLTRRSAWTSGFWTSSTVGRYRWCWWRQIRR